MRVQFQSPDGLLQTTPSKACDPALSTNIYLAGMRVSTQSSVKHIIGSGSQFTGGPLITLATSDASITASTYTVLQAPPAPVTAGLLLQSRFGFPVATDLAGNIVWYYAGDISFLGRPEAGGLFLGFLEDARLDTAHQVLREFDLAGTTIRETNAARINEQLAAIGKRPITAFHHEARGMPDGRVLALAATEQILTDVQGPGPVDVIGDMILVLDRDFQLLWAWDAFEHLDPYRTAILGETCTSSSSGGCPPVRLAAQANDWVHGNSLQLTPDGNILYSARHQDWVIKIDYRNGEGSGDVIWRLGMDGDFQILSADPSPWFSHQHDANIQPDDPRLLSLFDNGNTRQFTDRTAHSRGQVLQLDEQNRTVRVILSADLGMYSAALGSAQKLDNGNYHFNAGVIAGPPSTSQSMEVDLLGNIVYDIQAAEPLYRSFRVRDLYTATQWRTRGPAGVPF